MTEAELIQQIEATIFENDQELINGDDHQLLLKNMVAFLKNKTNVLLLTAADFEGDSYQNDDLVDKVPDIDFELITYGGSGVILNVGDGYTHDTNYGVITAPAQNYKLKIFK